MSIWLVQLTGDAFDLEALPDWFSLPEMRVTNETDGYYLTSSDFDSLKDASAVRDSAEQMKLQILGAAKLVQPNFGTIEIGAIILREDDGKRHIYMYVSGTATFRAKVSTAQLTAPGTESSSTTSRPSIWIGIARKNAKVAQALRVWGKGATSWDDLYRVYEVIESDAGKAIIRNQWATNAEIKRFTQTANSYEAVGDAARHAKPSIPAPANPMSIGEARGLLHRLLNSWVENKSDA